jgi:LysR family transcriptional regulator, regulator for metE and metH
MSLEIRHLKLVAAIADAGGMTRAANRLHLTQSALSHQLRDAEEQLGTPLFERHSRKMTLTPAGERLLQSAQAVLAEMDRAEKEIQKGNAQAKQLLRLATECYTVYHWLPPLLIRFQKKYPGVELQLVVEATDHPYEALLEGRLDLAISCTPIRNRKIEYTPLFEDEMVAIVPPRHPMARKNFATAQDFANETVFLYPPKSDSTLLNRILIPAGVWPRQIHEVTLTEAIVEMVKGGLGVAAVAHWAVAPQLASGALVGLPLTAHGVRRTWAAATLRNHCPQEYLQEFIRLLGQNPIVGTPRRRPRAAQSLGTQRTPRAMASGA